MMKRYSIAGLTVDMELFGRTEKQAEAYRIDKEGSADLTLRGDIRKLLETDSNADLDTALYILSGAKFARSLLRFDGTFLHASAVVLNGKAYLFSAYSGTGKSTHTEKWCRLFGAHYLNDDKPVLRLVDGVWMAYGTPWSGKNDLSTPEGVPLGGIAFLKRGEANHIRPLMPIEGLPLLMAQSLLKLEKEQMQTQLTLVDNLLRSVPLWELVCRNDDEAAQIAYAAMTGGTKECE